MQPNQEWPNKLRTDHPAAGTNRWSRGRESCGQSQKCNGWASHKQHTLLAGQFSSFVLDQGTRRVMTNESQVEAKLVKKVLAVAVDDKNEIEGVLDKFQLRKAKRVCVWMRRFANNSRSLCSQRVPHMHCGATDH